MKKNVGMIDKIIRIVFALVVAILYFTNIINGVLAIVLLVFAGVFLITSLVGFCPLYTVLGFKTTGSEEKVK